MGMTIKLNGAIWLLQLVISSSLIGVTQVKTPPGFELSSEHERCVTNYRSYPHFPPPFKNR